MKKLTILIAAFAGLSLSAYGQATPSPTATPTPPPLTPIFTAAMNVYTTLPKTATAIDRTNAYQAVTQAADEPVGIRAQNLVYLAFLQRGAGYAPDVYTATCYSAYQSYGSRDAFVRYAHYCYMAGGSYASQADALVPAFVTASPTTSDSYAALAYKAENAGDWPNAFTDWKQVADSYEDWSEWKGNAVMGMVSASKHKGDTPQATNAVIISYLTAHNVMVADLNFQKAANALNRSPNVISLADLKAFLVALERVVLVTDTNAKFLGTVQSQLAGLPTN